MYRYSSSSNQFAFRSDYPISNDQIARHAPSILATEAHDSRGDRYRFIPTIEVLNGLRSEGFMPFEVRQTKTRDIGKRGHTKHLIRLRREGMQTVNGTSPEIILLNSHDGTSSFQLLAGMFRMVCSNGLVAGTVNQDIRIRHSGQVVNDVIEGSYEVVDQLEQVSGVIDHWSGIQLDAQESRLLAEAAIEARWGDSAPIQPIQLLRPRRHEDNVSDLYTVFNRIQENMLKGDLSGRSASGRRTRTRAVSGVSENVKLNRALWKLAEKMAEIKS